MPPLPRLPALPRRALAVAAACVVGLAWLAGPAGAVELGQGFRAVTDAGAGPAALHGSTLAWLGADGVLRLTDLATGASRDLTFLPAGTAMQSIDFDGTWVAWCDDRFGDREAFAMDVRQLTLVRLSRNPAADTDITVGGGHAAWLHGGDLVGTDLAAPAMRTLSELGGPAFTPALDGDLLVWSQVVGSERHVFGMQWGGNATRLTSDPRTVHSDPVAGGGRLAWRAELFSATLDTPGYRSLGSRIQEARIQAATPAGVSLLKPRNVTDLGSHDEPALGGPWLAWLEALPEDAYGGVTAVELGTGASFQALAPLQAALVSDSHLVVVPSDGGPLQARPWVGDKDAAAPPALPLAAIALLGGAWLLRRRA